VGAVVGILLIAVRKHERAAPMPFGPFLAGAGWLMLMFGPPILARYFDFIPRLSAP
jgi:leader peptidase (prepilin peptidase)/N-methyltransferase